MYVVSEQISYILHFLLFYTCEKNLLLHYNNISYIFFRINQE